MKTKRSPPSNGGTPAPEPKQQTGTLVTSCVEATLIPVVWGDVLAVVRANDPDLVLFADVLAVVRGNDPDLVLFADVWVLVRGNDPRSGDLKSNQ